MMHGGSPAIGYNNAHSTMEPTTTNHAQSTVHREHGALWVLHDVESGTAMIVSDLFFVASFHNMHIVLLAVWRCSTQQHCESQ
mmetsp:Transcript_18052/g.34235  ORF Transcript_18052/g.34235 Transcript_18052/m.34235 type:complete len:83 (-) Transcript_18052:20-268(-)